MLPLGPKMDTVLNNMVNDFLWMLRSRWVSIRQHTQHGTKLANVTATCMLEQCGGIQRKQLV